MADAAEARILVQVGDHEPNCIATVKITDPDNIQRDLEKAFVELVKFIRFNPDSGRAYVVD